MSGQGGRNTVRCQMSVTIQDGGKKLTIFDISTIHSSDYMHRLNVSMLEDVGQGTGHPSCVAILFSDWSSGSCVPGLASDWSTDSSLAVIGQKWRNSVCAAPGGILKPVPAPQHTQGTQHISYKISSRGE